MRIGRKERTVAQNVNPIPEGYGTVTPYLRCRNAGEAIEFYKKAFGAEELVRMTRPDGTGVMHAAIRIGDSAIMISDEYPEWGAPSPLTLKGTCVTMQVYVADADAVHAKAVAAGAKATMPMTDMFWGDRCGKVVDPYGHDWSISTRKEMVSDEEMKKRAAAFFASMAGGKK